MLSSALRKSSKIWRPQRRSATLDAQSATLVQILLSATPTSTKICHLRCPERYSREDSAVGNADLNADLPSQMPRTLLSADSVVSNADLNADLPSQLSNRTWVGHYVNISPGNMADTTVDGRNFASTKFKLLLAQGLLIHWPARLHHQPPFPQIQCWSKAGVWQLAKFLPLKSPPYVHFIGLSRQL